MCHIFHLLDIFMTTANDIVFDHSALVVEVSWLQTKKNTFKGVTVSFAWQKTKKNGVNKAIKTSETIIRTSQWRIYRSAEYFPLAGNVCFCTRQQSVDGISIIGYKYWLDITDMAAAGV